MIRRMMIFWGGCIALYLLAVLPFRILLTDGSRADAMTVYAATALALCLIPTTITLVWSSSAQEKSPHQQLAAVLGGTGIRVFFVLLTALGLYQAIPFYKNHSGFWTWILVFYLATLTLEMALIVKGGSSSSSPALETGPAPEDAKAELAE